MTHTPTPWRIAPASAKFIADAEGVLVAQATVHAQTSYDYAAENAARIVNAVNAHDDLVSALKEARDWLSGWVSAEEQIAIIDEALAKAGAL